jgi:hypothetical protein
MTSSGISTERGSARAADAGFQPWHFYILLSMVGATAAVIVARDTHPAALLLLSGAVIAAGLVGLAAHHALKGFLTSGSVVVAPLAEREREALEREKALTLRSIKELEFDRAMGKVSDEDFKDLEARLRARAMSLIEQLEAAPALPDAGRGANRGQDASGGRVFRPGDSVSICTSCNTANDDDARFCKSCGTPLGGSRA